MEIVTCTNAPTYWDKRLMGLVLKDYYNTDTFDITYQADNMKHFIAVINVMDRVISWCVCRCGGVMSMARMSHATYVALYLAVTMSHSYK
jgi:hypothetical protein